MSDSLPEVTILAGPTAVGKTEVAVALARASNAEIISADSRQVYRELDIGTAKPSPEQRAAVPHHLVDFLDPRERYNAERFALDALRVVGELTAQGRRALVVGGTGFYLEALMQELSDIPPPDPDIEARLECEAAESGSAALHRRLAEVDAETAARLQPADRQRVLRALAVWETSGRPLSHFHRASPRRERVRVRRYVVLTRPREELYRRIDRRVDAMVQAGLAEEVRALAERYGWEASGLDALGYRQFREHLTGNRSLAQSVELLRRDTRRYAKRQLTWFRRVSPAVWVDLSDPAVGSISAILDAGV
ncbi:MAG: tRNA (adenosine(37)-N6)-dimethylallyltransferase MiaA [Armatimonadetes bacterium]|nr:tRNA (adenosine(37)-N6)-dimethylallyltransferase MiaA [Armatimonadota bacterium]